jgi:hypothetical protein
MNFTKEFKLFLKARYPILYISTTEEERLEYTIKSSVKESNVKRIDLRPTTLWHIPLHLDDFLSDNSDMGITMLSLFLIDMPLPSENSEDK